MVYQQQDNTQVSTVEDEIKRVANDYFSETVSGLEAPPEAP